MIGAQKGQSWRDQQKLGAVTFSNCGAAKRKARCCDGRVGRKALKPPQVTEEGLLAQNEVFQVA